VGGGERSESELSLELESELDELELDELELESVSLESSLCLTLAKNLL